MSATVPPGFVVKRVRLALGVEIVDACCGQRTAVPVVALDGVPRPLPRARRSARFVADEPEDDLVRLPRHASGVYALLELESPASSVVVRVFDPGSKFVARRFSIALSAGTPVVVRPHVFPGCAYNASSRATGVFGTVVRGAARAPVRWARVEARLVAALPRSGRLVGRAFSDERGEFLILLGAEASNIGMLVSPIPIELTAFGPLPAAPVPASAELPSQDPYWDVPLETIPVGAGPFDPVITGDALPPGFGATPTSTTTASCPLGQIANAQQLQFQ